MHFLVERVESRVTGGKKVSVTHTSLLRELRKVICLLSGKSPWPPKSK